ncbi:TIR domain-containing protein [Yersinia frederiksenii]|uniref:TIR domain-containing protein n=1 Tax=Yersinia frederiksenii TaxID=29484 RepID=UPI0011A9B2F8|nr:nucleotide-binding protein [Yersinia frederiksenii]
MSFDKNEIIEQLKLLKTRLFDEVAEAYSRKGTEYGQNRFEALKRKTDDVLNRYLPGESTRFHKSIVCYSFSMVSRWQDVGDWFLHNSGGKYAAYIDSLILDLQNDEYIPADFDKGKSEDQKSLAITSKNSPNSNIFIVHGHNGEIKERTARFIEKLDLKPIILHEQASKGKTIIEKLEHYTDVGYAIVLYTEDDLGNVSSSAEKGELNPRARQNVVFEHGLLIGLLGRENVMPLVSGEPELPGDISGMIYIDDDGWKLAVANELKSAGYNIDLNKAFT